MKRNWIILLGCLLSLNAHALIVSVDGKGNISEEGMELTINEAEEDPLTGDMTMELEGNLATNRPLTVTITRSSTGLTDEFCCANQCTAGNGETEETLDFTPNGLASWYTHYTPKAGSQETTVYRFDDGEETRVLTVHYLYEAQGLEEAEGRTPSVKTLRNGQVLIQREDKTYTIQGAAISEF